MPKTYSAKKRRIRVKVEGADKIVKSLKAMEDGASNVLLSAAKAGGLLP
jgi:coenzyme F420-reducing hydrogenase delta subunit